jgi:CRP/FNR family transcriptional regulator
MAATLAAFRDTGLPVLERFDFLESLPRDLREEILRGAMAFEMPGGAILYQPGQGPVAFLLRRGLLRAFFTTADGREATLAFIHDGEMAGGITVLGEPLNLTLQTVTATTALRLQQERLLRLAAENPALGIALARHLAHSLRKTFRVVTVRSLGSVRERVACDLLERACRRQLITGRLELRVSHAQLGDSVGSSREVVTRAIASLRASGLVRTARGVVSVSDPAGLAAIYSGFAV